MTGRFSICLISSRILHIRIGNTVILGLALARLCLGHRRENAFAIVDAQACTALTFFVIGIALARLGDYNWWFGRNQAVPLSDSQDVEKQSAERSARPRSSYQNGLALEKNMNAQVNEDVELGPQSPASLGGEWDDSGQSTRVGTPDPFRSLSNNAARIIGTSPVASPSQTSQSPPTHLPNSLSFSCSPPPNAPGRARLWLVVGTLFQSLLLIASGIASTHDNSTSKRGLITASSHTRDWSSVSGFIALALMSTSMGFQGVMAHRMGSGFGATVVLSSLWVELVGSPGGLRWKSYRRARVFSIMLFILGGLVGAVICDDKVLGIANALFIGAAFRGVIALSWVFVKGVRH